MFLVVGLGNPGDKYQKNRHNAGFILLDFLDLSFEKDKYVNAFVAKEVFHDKEVIFIKPETFMNNSGLSVSYIKEKYEIENKNIAVVYDDLDLPFGDIRISFDRGDGGHNGIKSIVKDIGSSSFLRVRVGIAPRDEDGRAIKPKGGFFTSQSDAISNFVLKDFSASDLEKLKNLSPKIEDIIKTFIKEGREVAMNRFN